MGGYEEAEAEIIEEVPRPKKNILRYSKCGQEGHTCKPVGVTNYDHMTQAYISRVYNGSPTVVLAFVLARDPTSCWCLQYDLGVDINVQYSSIVS
jgi:hypothetical protein